LFENIGRQLASVTFGDSHASCLINSTLHGIISNELIAFTDSHSSLSNLNTRHSAPTDKDQDVDGRQGALPWLLLTFLETLQNVAGI